MFEVLFADIIFQCIPTFFTHCLTTKLFRVALYSSLEIWEHGYVLYIKENEQDMFILIEINTFLFSYILFCIFTCSTKSLFVLTDMLYLAKTEVVFYCL